MQPNLRTVQTRRAAILREVAALQTEDAELENVETILDRLANGAGAAKSKTPRANGTAKAGPKSGAKRSAKSGAKKNATKRANGALSQRDLILDALQHSSQAWLKIGDVIATAKSRHGVIMPARSISPLMSNLKKTKQIVRKGRLVALPKRAKGKA